MHRIHGLFLAAMLGSSSLAGCGASHAEPHWSYSGATGPAHWAELSPDFAACGFGVNQSPVDIHDPIPAELEPLEFDYRAGSVDLVNNGHTLQLNAKSGNTLRIGGESLALTQLHFHSPSEHRIDGRSFPLEAHLVHRDERGFLVVVAVLLTPGDLNPDVQKIGRAAPPAGSRVAFDLDFEALQLHRKHASYYRYSGSLTTPPCTEGVRWYILKATGDVAPEQVTRFVDLIGEDARGPQPINARVVIEH